MSAPMEPEEGQYVAKVVGWNEQSATGKLLAITGSSGHVRWDSGAEAGQITLTAMDDIVVVGASEPARHVASRVDDLWDDSLHVGAVEGFEREASISDDEFLFGGPGEFDAYS